MGVSQRNGVFFIENNRKIVAWCAAGGWVLFFTGFAFFKFHVLDGGNSYYPGGSSWFDAAQVVFMIADLHYQGSILIGSSLLAIVGILTLILTIASVLMPRTLAEIDSEEIKIFRFGGPLRVPLKTIIGYKIRSVTIRGNELSLLEFVGEDFQQACEFPVDLVKDAKGVAALRGMLERRGIAETF